MHFKKCEICGSRGGRVGNQKRIFLARFPLDAERCKKWVKVTGKEDLAYVPIEKLHQLRSICGKHFRPQDFRKNKTRLNRNAVPSVMITAEPLSDEILKEFPLHIAACNKILHKRSPLNKSQRLTTGNGAESTVVPVINKEHNYCRLDDDTPKPSTIIADSVKSANIALSVVPNLTVTTTKAEISSIFNRKRSGVTIHNFPHPQRFPQQFQAWINVVGASLAHLTPQEIHKSKKVCTVHFKASDRNRNNRLNALAIPSLHLPDNISLSFDHDYLIERVHQDHSYTTFNNTVTISDASAAEEDSGGAAEEPDDDDAANLHSGYRCDVCQGDIFKFRYACVECLSFDVCGACEARGEHATHYVLRVPANKLHVEVQAVLENVRNFLSERGDGDKLPPEVKEEKPEELFTEGDPLAAPPEACLYDDSEEQRHTEEAEEDLILIESDEMEQSEVDDDLTFSILTKPTGKHRSVSLHTRTKTEKINEETKKALHSQVKAVPLREESQKKKHSQVSSEPISDQTKNAYNQVLTTYLSEEGQKPSYSYIVTAPKSIEIAEEPQIVRVVIEPCSGEQSQETSCSGVGAGSSIQIASSYKEPNKRLRRRREGEPASPKHCRKKMKS